MRNRWRLALVIRHQAIPATPEARRMNEVTALPGQPVPGAPFRRGDPVIYRGDRMIYLGRLECDVGTFEILWNGTGRCFARLAEVKRDMG